MRNKWDTESFITKAHEIHGNRYDYSGVLYRGIDSPVEIKCPVHGVFSQRPYIHIKGRGCPSCGHEKTILSTRMTEEEFILKSKKKHQNRYDYSKIRYVNNITNVIITCPEHGDFLQRPTSHLRGCGCPKCYGTPRKDIYGFILEARKVHGEKYDYSMSQYLTARDKIQIICPEHGPFYQIPYNHLKGHRCPKCAGKAVADTNEFISKANEVHRKRYDYSEVRYVNSHTKVSIICNNHGRFLQKPNNHLLGEGCPKCKGMYKTTADFIEEAVRIHGDKYDYSKVSYIDSRTTITINCPKHGEFQQSPTKHLHGHGCPKCSGRELTTVDFITEAVSVHGDRYDYSKVHYDGALTPICIICREHGEFWQTPSAHLVGKGCPICRSSHLEGDVRSFLKEKEIRFEEQKVFSWLRYISPLRLDFYLPEYNVAIECQGIQHFSPVKHFGGQAKYDNDIIKDSQKRALCESHGIRVLYYSTLDIKYPYHVIGSLNEILTELSNA